MGRQSNPFTIPPARQPKIGFRSRFRAAQKPEEEFLDRWSPKTDKDHYRRVRLYRKRRGAIFRHRRTPNSPNGRISRTHHDTDGDMCRTNHLEPTADGHITSTMLQRIDNTESIISPSEMGSTFQDELDNYDAQIKSLQQNEWPGPPNPRSSALRIRGSEFSEQTAKDIKRWSFVQGVLYGENSAALRHSDHIHPSTSYRVGVIFSAPHHTPGAIGERWVSVSDPYHTATPFGAIHSKYRKMVVAKVFGEHCVCLPIYSHNQQGLDGKEFLAEYISIRDAHDPEPEVAEGVHQRLLAIRNRDFHGKIVSGRSSVKLTEFYSHRYDVPATMEGKLESTSLSTERLLDLVAYFSA
ncbi:hypothetical protein SAMD00023353_3000250 [Rosellinia necatrix]|uniref:DUF6590 domain-containing protein n=1 Tax=Rosellinia necatrix TaxID=77044 RepID=A0A1W2TJ60_ROSNE|nr:hypothetical protein SAMD00023353_3000250 [Rosellinia necatrix]